MRGPRRESLGIPVEISVHLAFERKSNNGIISSKCYQNHASSYQVTRYFSHGCTMSLSKSIKQWIQVLLHVAINFAVYDVFKNF